MVINPQYINEVKAAAGGGLDDDQMWEVLSRYLGREGDWAWTVNGGLLDLRIAEQVERLLAARMTDIHQQMEIANADVEVGARPEAEVQEWKRRARRLRLMLQRRRTQVKPHAAAARIERASRYIESNAQPTRSVVRRLAFAIHRHQQAVLNDTDDDTTDEDLWQMLDDLTLPDGPDHHPVPLRAYIESGRWHEGEEG
jgi:hypothetical protein